MEPWQSQTDLGSPRFTEISTRFRRFPFLGLKKLMLALPTGQHRTLKLASNEVLDLGRLVAFDERLDPRFVFVSGSDRKEIGIRPLRFFLEKCVFLRVQARRDRKIGVHRGPIDIVKGARRLRGIDFCELELLWIADDIEHRRIKAYAVPQLDRPLVLQKEQGSSAIGRVVLDRDLGASGDLSPALIFFE